MHDDLEGAQDIVDALIGQKITGINTWRNDYGSMVLGLILESGKTVRLEAFSSATATCDMRLVDERYENLRKVLLSVIRGMSKKESCDAHCFDKFTFGQLYYHIKTLGLYKHPEVVEALLDIILEGVDSGKQPII